MNVTLATRSSAINLTIAATSLGFALVQLDVSVLNVALARIGAALGTGVTGLQWVVDAYTIAFASLLLAAGALGDRIGARGAYVGGLALLARAPNPVRSRRSGSGSCRSRNWAATAR
jgi:MFS transporter, DHA2 family, methylenomycin A resistance protein